MTDHGTYGGVGAGDVRDAAGQGGPAPSDAMPAPAPERMRAAFWTLLEAKPYPSVTVRDLARAAGVNKNTFYYHYASLDELAQDAFEANFPHEVFAVILRRLIEGDAHGSEAPRLAVSGPALAAFQGKFAHLTLAVGDHSSPLLQRLLKDSMMGVWCALLGIDRDAFGEQSRLAVDFLYGGIVGLLTHYADRTALPANAAGPEDLTGGTGADMIPPLFETPFFRRLSTVIPPMVLSALLDDGVEVPPILRRAAERGR